MIKRFDFWFLVVNFCMLVVAGIFLIHLCTLVVLYYNTMQIIESMVFLCSGVLMYSNDMARLLCTVHCSCIAMTIVLLDASRQSTRARMLIPSLCGIFSYILLGLYIYFMQVQQSENVISFVVYTVTVYLKPHSSYLR